MDYLASGLFTNDGSIWVSGVDPSGFGALALYDHASSHIPQDFDYYQAALNRITGAAAVHGISTDDVARANQEALKEGISVHQLWLEVQNGTRSVTDFTKKIATAIALPETAGISLLTKFFGGRFPDPQDVIVIVVGIALLSIAAISLVLPTAERGVSLGLKLAKGAK